MEEKHSNGKQNPTAEILYDIMSLSVSETFHRASFQNKTRFRLTFEKSYSEVQNLNIFQWC